MTRRSAHRWFGVLRTPIGLTATILTVRRAGARRRRPDPVDRPGRRDRHRRHPAPARRAEHWAGTDNLGRDIFYRVLVATRLSVVLALLATAIAVVVGLVLGTAPFLLGRRSGAPVTGVGEPRGRVPRAPARPVLRGHLRGRRERVRCWPSAWPAPRRFARLTPDPRRRRRRPRLRRGRAHRRRRARPDPAASRAAQHRRAADRQRDDRRRAERCWPSPGSRSSAWASRPPSYDWGRLLYDGLGAIYVNPRAALAPGIAVVIAGLAFNLFGESRRQGPRHRRHRGRPPAVERRRAAHPPRRRPAAADAPHDSADLVLDVRDLSVDLPGPRRPDPPGARRDLLGRGAARPSASSASPGRASR